MHACGHRHWCKQQQQQPKQTNSALIKYCILEPIGNFISITDGKVIAWNAAGEAAKTAVDGNCFQSLIERG